MTGVEDAIACAEQTPVPVPVAAARSRKARDLHAGSRAHALFDGVTTALATQIVGMSRPGCEEEMAINVARLLMHKVLASSCAGRA